MDSANRKVAIITGGASGIGKAITLALAQEGYTVVLNYNTSAKAAEELVQSLSDNHHEGFAMQADISDFDQCGNLVDLTLRRYGRIDVLVNNAGITADGLIIRMSESQFDQVIATDLKGVWNMSKLAVRPMMKNSFGRIINISSVSGLVGLAGQTNYSAAKAGVIGLTKALAKEVGSRNITVNAVAPGYIETAMTDKLPPEVREAALKSIPLGRLGKAEDVAQAIVFLASEKAAYITGQIIVVDGGLAM